MIRKSLNELSYLTFIFDIAPYIIKFIFFVMRFKKVTVNLSCIVLMYFQPLQIVKATLEETTE